MDYGKSRWCFRLTRVNLCGWKNTAVVLGLQSPEQFNVMLEYGDKSAISMDATFGTSACNYFLYTLVVFDACRNGFPSAWIITNKQDSESLIVFLKPLADKLRAARPGWRPNAFIVDNDEAEHNALRYICCIFNVVWV